jgi:acyl-CoA reductase-like NAD-dependent aldehyde dehydrogenase
MSLPQMNGNTFLHFIGGRFVDSESGRQFEKRSPVDGSLIGMVAEAGQREVDAAVRAATEAMAGPWGKLTAGAAHGHAACRGSRDRSALR